MGAIIVPPIPSFNNQPQRSDEMVQQSVGRMLDLFDLGGDTVLRWNGTAPPTPKSME